MARRRFHKKMLKALDQTITAYEKLIANPGKYVTWWAVNYGSHTSCSLCRATATNLSGGCHKCVLGATETDDAPCANRGAGRSTFNAFAEKLEKSPCPSEGDEALQTYLDELVITAKARLAWIKRRAKARGAFDK